MNKYKMIAMCSFSIVCVLILSLILPLTIDASDRESLEIKMYYKDSTVTTNIIVNSDIYTGVVCKYIELDDVLTEEDLPSKTQTEGATVNLNQTSKDNYEAKIENVSKRYVVIYVSIGNCELCDYIDCNPSASKEQNNSEVNQENNTDQNTSNNDNETNAENSTNTQTSNDSIVENVQINDSQSNDFQSIEEAQNDTDSQSSNDTQDSNNSSNEELNNTNQNSDNSNNTEQNNTNQSNETSNIIEQNNTNQDTQTTEDAQQSNIQNVIQTPSFDTAETAQNNYTDSVNTQSSSTVQSNSTEVSQNTYVSENSNLIDMNGFQEIESVQKTATANTGMPQTGENDSIKIMGIVIFSIISIVSFYKYKKER